MMEGHEQLKLWKEFEWTWEEYDVLKHYDRYDQKLLILTKHALTNETNQRRQQAKPDTKVSTAESPIKIQEDYHCRSYAKIVD